MSIDGIGRSGGAGEKFPVSAASPAQETFELAAADSAAASVAGGANEAFQALGRGEISVDQYLDARVEGALTPLAPKLSPEQLEFVRTELRSALEADPVLVELVRKATGGIASPE